MPPDWAHILKAIYKVRSNLFHGQKAAHSEMDKCTNKRDAETIERAYRTQLAKGEVGIEKKNEVPKFTLRISFLFYRQRI